MYVWVLQSETGWVCSVAVLTDIMFKASCSLPNSTLKELNLRMLNLLPNQLLYGWAEKVWRLAVANRFINRVHGKNSLRRCIRDFPTSLMLQTLFFTNIKATGVRNKITLRGYFCIQLTATLRPSKFVGTAKALNRYSFLHKTNYLMQAFF